MKKILKIFGLTLGGIVGVMLLVVGALFWVVFTPSRLTPIIRQVADKMVVCDYEIGRVELTFFSTFPEFGLRADHLCLVNPSPAAEQDTLLYASEVLATLDLHALFQQRHLHVRQLSLQQAQVYACITDSATNFDIFALPSSSSSSDTAAAALPFDSISVEHLSCTARSLVLNDSRDSIQASLADLQLSAHMLGWGDVYLSLACPTVCAQVGSEVYADSLSLQLDLPLALDAELSSVELREASVQINDLRLMCDGIVSMADSLSMQLSVLTHQWPLSQIFDLVPASMLDALHGIEADGLLSLQADISGYLTDTQYPVVDAHVLFEQAHATYSQQPYCLRDMHLDLDAHLDLNQPARTWASIHRLAASTKHSSFTLSGKLLQPLTDMQLQLRLGANAYLPEFADLLPENIELHGRVKTNMDIQASLQDLMAMQLDRARLSGKLHFYDFIGDMYDMELSSPEMHIAFALPHAQPVNKQCAWANANISFTELEFSKTTELYAGIDAAEIELSLSNIIQDKSLWNADLHLRSTGNLHAQMDTISASIAQPQLHAQVQNFNPNDSAAIPTATLALSLAQLQAFYGQAKVQSHTTDLQLALSPSELDSSIPVMMASLDAEALHAQMDSTMEIQTEMLGVLGITQYNKRGENLLLQWNPQLQVNMLGGDVRTSMVAQQIKIPHIDFAYNNREFHIEDSQLQIGNSDFALQGDVRNIADWLSGEGDLQGELNFISDHTDVNELMALFSADSGSEEVVALSEVEQVPDESGVSEPFLVPTNLDIVLNTRIEEASVFNEKLRNLKGKLYVQDGMLVLEEIGFICKAAKLQLTAMYRTPRRNHIYVGMDYHMVDINIEELVNMLPQLDTIVPMLNSFKGRAEFHLAAETYTTAEYKIKPSTLRGACSIAGKDLVVMDSETFSKMAKMLMFSKKTANVVDSISAEITVYKKEIDVYPLCVTMDNYKVALGGRHNLDMTFNYDVNVLSPIYLGVNVSGNIDDLKIKLAKCKYAKDFRPVRAGKVEQQSAQLRGIIRESMRKNMRIESDNNNK